MVGNRSYLLRSQSVVMPRHRMEAENSSQGGAAQRTTARFTGRQSRGRAARGTLQCRAAGARRKVGGVRTRIVGIAGTPDAGSSPGGRGIDGFASAAAADTRRIPGGGKGNVC